MNKTRKLIELKDKLAEYKAKLAKEMVGYRGVIHESASSELKHSKVMVFKAMVRDLKTEIQKLED